MQDSFDRYRQKYPEGHMSNNTWGGRLEVLAETIPDRVAFIQGDRELTWKQFDERVNKLANAFLDFGIKKEERVAIMGFNCIEWMKSYFAASKIGAVPVNVNPRFVPDELKHVLEDSDSVMLVLECESVEPVNRLRGELPLVKNYVVWGKEVPSDMVSYEELMRKYPSTKPEPGWEVTNEDFAYLFYTGGTTGYPKGTVWDYQSRVRGLDMIFWNGVVPVIEGLGRVPEGAYMKLINSFFPPEVGLEAIEGMRMIVTASEPVFEKMERLLSTPPAERGPTQEIWRGPEVISLMKDLLMQLFGTSIIYTLTGSRVRLLPAAPLFHGAAYECDFAYIGAIGATSIYLTSRHFDARELWETVERRKAQYLLIVGDAFAIPMVEELGRREYDLSSVAGIISSGVIFSPKIKRKFLEYMPSAFMLDEMGTTESSAAYTHFTTSADEEIPMLKTKVSLSEPFPCRVINPETGKDVKPGEKGEFVYGGYMALGYWKDPEKTSRSFRTIDGKRWFFVGDEGTVDEDGYFHFIGRGPTVINTGGEKVYPEEVEETIKTYWKVRDAGVTGVPDERWGEAVTAVVELNPGEKATPEEIIDFCRGKMAGYKKPKHVIFVEKFPRAAAGKIERRELKEFAKKTLGL